jgi:serine/threonine-protein kinase
MHYFKEGHRLHNYKYQLLNILGEGGFSLTYRGAWRTEVQGTLGKVPTLVPVCIKEYFFKDYCLRNPQTYFIETNSETGREIFDKNKEKIIKEARILSEIHHPNVVNVLEVFKQNNTVYIVMEFIAGHSLKQDVEQNGVFSEEKLKKVIFKIGQALDYIHEKNILHLDIKPNNILIDKNNNPKLIDFGISKRYDLSGDQETSTTLQAASKGYASIEQYDSEGMQVFSPRPDIYSLGATMYYLLTGQVPTESILRSTKGLQEPKELNPHISDNTQKVILKAMALNANERYETIPEMLTDLGFDPETDKIDLSSVIENEAEKMALLKSINEQPYDADQDDETVIHPNIEEKIDEKKKSYFWMYLLSILLIAAILFLFFNDTNRTNTDNLPTPDDIAFNNYFESGINHYNKNNLSQAKEDFVKALEIRENPDAQAYIIQIDSLNNLLLTPNTADPEESPEETKVDIENSRTVDPSQPVDTKEVTYSRLFNEANIANNQQEYSRAVQLIQEALSYKETPEAKELMKRIEQEMDRMEVEKKKKNYDIRQKFGTFDVVKKLSDGKYGAIDSLGNEKIPCIYTYTELSGKNRLFQREDNLYDLYAPSGTLIDKDINGQNFQ